MASNSNISEDRLIREKLQKQDEDFQNQLKDEMAKQQETLKGYFKQFKKPVDHDPRKIKRGQSAAEDRRMVFKQIARPFQLFRTFYQFWNMECATPEQTQTLRLCKKNMLINMAKGSFCSLLLTSYISFRYRSIFTFGLHALGLGTGLMSGMLFGAITSTKYTLEQFQKLGEGYQLGRNAAYEIERYRMDKDKNKVIQ